MQQQGRIRRENQDSRGSRRDVSRPGYCFSVLFFNTILVTNDILDISSPSQTKSSSCQWSVQLVLPTIPRLHETLTFTVTGDHDRSSVIPCACVFFHEPPPLQWTAQRPLGMLFYVSLFILFTNYVYRYKKYCLLQYRCPGTCLYEDSAVFRRLRVDQVNNDYAHEYDHHPTVNWTASQRRVVDEHCCWTTV